MCLNCGRKTLYLSFNCCLIPPFFNPSLLLFSTTYMNLPLLHLRHPHLNLFVSETLTLIILACLSDLLVFNLLIFVSASCLSDPAMCLTADSSNLPSRSSAAIHPPLILCERQVCLLWQTFDTGSTSRCSRHCLSRSGTDARGTQENSWRETGENPGMHGKEHANTTLKGPELALEPRRKPLCKHLISN